MVLSIIKSQVLPQIQIKKRENDYWLKLDIKNIYPNYQTYSDIDPTFNA
jgi:hypothetical protein